MTRRRKSRSAAQKAEGIVDSTVVEIIGDQNQVQITWQGRPLLHLTHPLFKVRQAQTLVIPTLRLLNTFLARSTFVGRTDLMRDFEDWLRYPRAFSIRTIIGPAGAGKTRFAMELMGAVHSDPFDPKAGPRTEGWVGGFMETLADDPKPPAGSLVLPRPVLVVVDYAASLRKDLRAWLVRLAMGLSDGSKPLRVLLLERHGSKDEGWLKDILSETWAWRAISTLLNPSGWAPLP